MLSNLNLIIINKSILLLLLLILSSLYCNLKICEIKYLLYYTFESVTYYLYYVILTCIFLNKDR